MVSTSGHGVMINLINSTAYDKFEGYDKFVDKFQDVSKVKNPAVTKAKVLQLLRAFKRKRFGE